MQFRRQAKGNEVGVNLTPLIDVVFLLLIFFMVSTTFKKESHLNLSLPEAEGQPVATQVKQIEVIVGADGAYAVNNQSLVNNTLDTLKAAIKKMAEGKTDLPMIISADAKADHENVVRVMDAAGQLGFVNLSITTRRPAQAGE